MRGLACVLMIETHCYDSWLSAEAKKTEFFRYSQMGGTLPAPLFIFLAGVSVALVTEKLRGEGAKRGASATQVRWGGAGGSGSSAAAAVLRARNLVWALAAAAVVALATPVMWTTWRPRFLPWQVESYVNGVHVFDKQQEG